MSISTVGIKYGYREKNTEGSEGSSGNESTENKSADNLADFSNVWNTDSSSSDNQAGSSPQRVIIENQNNAQELTPQQKLSAHIESLNLTDGFNVEKLNNPETAVQEMQKMQAATYAAAMKDTNTLIQQAVSAVKDELTQQTVDTVNSNQAVGKMNSELSYTKSPAYKPVADSLLIQFQNKGQTVDEAVGNVGKYFAQMASDVNSTLPKVPNNRLNGNNFQGNNKSGSDGADGQDWMSILSASTK